MDGLNQEQIKAHLMLTDPEFRDLYDQHHSYDERLVALEAKERLTYDEQMEETRLKKLKLHAKDRMQAIMSQHGDLATVN